MTKNTFQEDMWSGDFGKVYTDRNTLTPEEVNDLYIENYGVSRTQLNSEFLDNLKLKRILEVGCNVGNQLNLLKKWDILTYGELNYRIMRLKLQEKEPVG